MVGVIIVTALFTAISQRVASAAIVPWVYDPTLFGNPFHWGQMRDERNELLYPQCSPLTATAPRRIYTHPIGTIQPPYVEAVQANEALTTGDATDGVTGLSLSPLSLSLVATMSFTIQLIDGGGPATSLDQSRFRPQLTVSVTTPRDAVTNPLTGKRMLFTQLNFVTPSENELSSAVALEMQFVMESADSSRKLSISVFAVESMTGGLSGLEPILDNIPAPITRSATAAVGNTSVSTRITASEWSPMLLFPSNFDFIYFEATVPRPPCMEVRDTVLLTERVSIATHQLRRLRNRLFGANSTRIANDLLSHEADYTTLLNSSSAPDCASTPLNASCFRRQSLLNGNLARNSAVIPPVLLSTLDTSTVRTGSTTLYVAARSMTSLQPWDENDPVWEEARISIASLCLAGVGFLISVGMLGVSLCRNRM